MPEQQIAATNLVRLMGSPEDAALGIDDQDDRLHLLKDGPGELLFGQDGFLALLLGEVRHHQADGAGDLFQIEASEGQVSRHDHAVSVSE